MKRAYTLLADDTLAVSGAAEQQRRFAAHLIYGCLTNDQVVFSDNQVVNSRNLRALVDRDGTVRSLMADKLFGIALRAADGEDRPSTIAAPGARLRRVAEAFDSEGKLRDSVRVFSPERTLDFIEAHASLIPWTYTAVRNGFTDGCLKAFGSERSRTVLGDAVFDAAQEEIGAEIERSAAVDAGLGRQFLQVRLPELLAARGHALSPEQTEHLRDCSEGPYLSNLPRVLGLDPIYEARHRSAFDLMRDASVARLGDAGAPRDQRVKLSADFFIEGLLRLDADDVHALRATDAFKTFIASSSAAELSQRAVDDLAVAFEELSIEIEDRIIGRFPELGLHTSAPEPRVLRKRWARVQTAAGVMFEMANLALTTAGLPSIPGLGQDMLVTEARRRTGAGEERLARSEAARRRVSLSRLSAFLGARKADDTLGARHQLAAADSFDETVVD